MNKIIEAFENLNRAHGYEPKDVEAVDNGDAILHFHNGPTQRLPREGMTPTEWKRCIRDAQAWIRDGWPCRPVPPVTVNGYRTKRKQGGVIQGRS